MVKAQDLRLGNYLEYQKYKSTFQGRITSISNGKFTFDHLNAFKETSGFVFGINLTEEWLVKFGFYISSKNGRYGSIFKMPIYDYNYVLERDWREDPSYHFGIEYTDSPICSDEGKVYNFAFEIKYVHRLQNIYHSLTGIELTLNA